MLERLATWEEIRHMTIDDVDLMNIAADEWRGAEIRAQKGRASAREPIPVDED